MRPFDGEARAHRACPNCFGDGPLERSLQFQVMRGFTLLELLVVVTVAGILLAIAVPRTRAELDRTVVRSAAMDVRTTLGLARALALSSHAMVTVDVDGAQGMLRIRRGADVVMRRGVGMAHGVRLGATRDSLAYDPYGMGRGASNLSIVVRKGAAAETVFVSRLGRIR
jgi:prepilin-type N-terminal cleavage/methylation domain-containing protein